MISAKQNLVGKITAKQSLKGKLNNAIVYPKLEDLTVVPSKEQQEFNHPSSYGYDNVTVSGDENLLPENIKKDVSIFGVVGIGEINNNNAMMDTSITKSFSQYSNVLSKYIKTIPQLDTSNVTSMNGMFNFCQSLTSLDLSNFDTSNVTSMGLMFYYCSGLTSLDLSNFDFSKLKSYDSMLTGIPEKCLIYVKDETAKEWITSKFKTLTNVQIKSSD